MTSTQEMRRLCSRLVRLEGRELGRVDPKPILNRIARLEGQLRGVRAMMESGRECEEIVGQLSACHSALESATKMVLIHYLEECITDGQTGGSDAELDRVAELIMKTRF